MPNKPYATRLPEPLLERMRAAILRGKATYTQASARLLIERGLEMALDEYEKTLDSLEEEKQQAS